MTSGSCAGRDWQTLVDCAIDQCQAEWISGMNGDLLAAARRSKRGRRLLARQLAAGPAQALMSIESAATLRTLPPCDWIFWSRENLRARVVDVGALALAPGIRPLVDRRAVRLIRLALGDERYTWLCSHDTAYQDEMSACNQQNARRTVDDLLSQTHALRDQLEQRGLDELRGALDNGPRLMHERVCLLYPPRRSQHAIDTWLAPGVALAHMHDSDGESRSHGEPAALDVPPVPESMER